MGPTLCSTRLTAPILLPHFRVPLLFLLHFDHPPRLHPLHSPNLSKNIKENNERLFHCLCQPRAIITERAWLQPDSWVKHCSRPFRRQWGGREMQFTCFSMLGPQYQANLSVQSLYATTVHRDSLSVVWATRWGEKELRKRLTKTCLLLHCPFQPKVFYNSITMHSTIKMLKSSYRWQTMKVQWSLNSPNVAGLQFGQQNYWFEITQDTNIMWLLTVTFSKAVFTVSLISLFKKSPGGF